MAVAEAPREGTTDTPHPHRAKATGTGIEDKGGKGQREGVREGEGPKMVGMRIRAGKARVGTGRVGRASLNGDSTPRAGRVVNLKARG